MSEKGCQVDFYLLKTPGLDEQRLACRLSLMAWERGHRVSVVTGNDRESETLDNLMWETPPGRFLPHQAGDGDDQAPVRIIRDPDLIDSGVVINLSHQPLSGTGRFERLLEIVPVSGPGLKASRNKFRHYRDLGIEPATHEIKK